MHEYTIGKCAEMIEKDRATLVRILRSVPPDAGTASRPLYRLATVVKALISYETKPDGRRGNGDEARLAAERARLAKEQADMAAMKNAVMRREWAHLPSIQRFLEHLLIACRNRLLNLPGECAFELAMLPQEQVYEILDAAVRDKLEEIADPKNAAADAAAAGIDFDKTPLLETEKTPGDEEGASS
jgi:phage terminase Nu1 subunit (DNA packaging protein)